MGTQTSLSKDFNMLSLIDLLEARDLFHVHLMRKQNVVGTAVGRYLIRNAGVPDNAPRTLANSQVKDISWPCVMVFVDSWADAATFGADRKLQADDFVPRAIYMPDGRTVPICVVEAPRDESDPVPLTETARSLNFPSNLVGGGYPVIAEVQDQEHIASIGCMVTDGHKSYALTNRHVSGGPGEVVYSLLNGKRERIGVSAGAELQITRRRFSEVYDGWPGKDVFLNLDIGLIEIDDQSLWTAQVYGIGEIGHMADVNIHTISLRLIGCPVRAYGCASGQMAGQIFGMFYRYKSVGGFDYVADFLIGPQNGKELATRPGDSGTLWLLDTGDAEAGLMPLALQWGGHVFVEKNKKTRLPFALATGLSNVCNLLEVDLVRDWNIGNVDYWGSVGHYAIANKATDAIANTNLKALMKANLQNITFDADHIRIKELQGLSTKPFVPLADVPDLVWKIGHGNRGGPEHPNHFADMDHPSSEGTLLELCKGKPENVSVPVWQKYYTNVKDSSRGLLPFRVWQFYQSMVEFVKQGDVNSFVCAAGIVSHYVGDACQPLHISYMFNGDPGDLGADGNPRATGVHAAYEDDMVNRHTVEIFQGVDAGLAAAKKPRAIATGHDAGVAVVDLMQSTFDLIQPPSIVNEFNKAKAATGGSKSGIADALWSAFGGSTVKVIADGCAALAGVWDAAWVAGNGDHNIRAVGAVDQQALIALYQDHKFMPSMTLDQIGTVLTDAAAPTHKAAGR